MDIENAESTFSEEEYQFLKENTVLGPIAALKLSNYKEDMQKCRIWYYHLEGELMDFDFAELREFECKLRFEAWKRKCSVLWHINTDELGLTEFAKRAMDNDIAKQKRYAESKKRRLKK